MTYSVLDDYGTVVERFPSLEKAQQFLENNSDICSTITNGTGQTVKEEENNEKGLLSKQTGNVEDPLIYNTELMKNIKTNFDEQFEQKVKESTAAAIGSRNKVTVAGLITASEAREAIKIANEARYDEGLIKLIAAVIEGGGSAEAPELNRYCIAKLTSLGYFVKKAGAAYIVTVDTKPIVLDTQLK